MRASTLVPSGPNHPWSVLPRPVSGSSRRRTPVATSSSSSQRALRGPRRSSASPASGVTSSRVSSSPWASTRRRPVPASTRSACPCSSVSVTAISAPSGNQPANAALRRPNPATWWRRVPSGRSTHSSVRGAPPGATTQASHCPSGDQLNASTGSSPTGSATGGPASTSQTQTPGVPARSERNATRRPSGDGAGAKSAPAPAATPAGGSRVGLAGWFAATRSVRSSKPRSAATTAPAARAATARWSPAWSAGRSGRVQQRVQVVLAEQAPRRVPAGRSARRARRRAAGRRGAGWPGTGK